MSSLTNDSLRGAVDPSGHYLNVASDLGNNIVAFAINRNTGQLAAITGSPFPFFVGSRRMVFTHG